MVPHGKNGICVALNSYELIATPRILFYTHLKKEASSVI